ncbi:MAG: hypothetical protein RLZZ127_181, partial [Planctomycetota bacterium]
RIAPYGGAVLGLPGAATQAAAVTVTGDATAPARPAAPAVAGNGTPRPTVTGVTEPFATVRIRDNGILVGTVTADAQGQWTWTPASDLAAGIHQITAEAVDGSGNASAASPATRVEVSAAPVIAVPAAVEPDLVLP